MNLFSNKLGEKNKFTKKIIIFLVAFIILFSSFNISVEKAQAQLPVTDAAGLSAKIGGTIWQKLTRTLGIVLQKAGSMAFQQVLRSALNKIAYDTANYIGSGGQGQKPMFITNPGEYLTNIGDEALGQFVESFVGNLNSPVDPACDAALTECQKKCSGGLVPSDPNAPMEPISSTCLADCKSEATRCATRVAPSGTNASGTPLTSNQTAINQSHGQTPSSFNVCAPSSLEAKLKIGLGLAEQSRPTGPNCTASAMYKNWETGISNKINDWKDPNFLDKFSSIFDPRSNDMGIYLLARTDASSKAIIDTKKGEDAMIKTKGWVETTDVAGNLTAPPGEAENANKESKTDQKNQFGKTTGDILVDTANIFLNQLFMSAFSNLMGSLGKKTTDINKALGGVSNSSSYQSDPNIVYGEPQLKEITSRLLTPNFGSNADYDILSELAICLDPANPGPTNCVVDDKFVQGVSEKKTVIEAAKGGYLHGDWIFTSEPQTGSYSSSYNLRNISILRKFRILPVGWEEAAKQVGASTTTKTTLMDLISCFDGMDEYNQFSNGFNKNDQGWCRGLIDPNWVLKAPANYCKKQGVSAQIMNKDQIPGMKGNAGVPDTLSTLSLTRAEDYCADNQSCIKEKSNGSCEVYGYCNEEKRTWNFGNDSCNPNYNTCQSFINTSNKQSISYLQNTLDYGSCTPESAGCKRYSTSGTYSTSTGTVSWSNSSVDPDNDIYLNRSTKTCTNKDEGCTELIRVKPTWGANLVMNSDFTNEDDFVGASTTIGNLNDWPISADGAYKATIVDASLEPGGHSGKALKLETSGTEIGTHSDYNNPSKSLLPINVKTITGQSYTLSADVYLSIGSSVFLTLGEYTEGFVASSTIKNSWQHVTVTRRVSGSSFSEPYFNIFGDGAGVTFYVKNIKLELSNWDTGYSSYGAAKVYEKLIPKYLENVCYIDAPNNYKLVSNAPAVCSIYTRRCNKDEVGCELYKSVKNNFSVSAQVQDTDYCPGECLGYDTYITKETYFNVSTSTNLIPTTATACSASAAGCNEFTNLDEINQGGENREYYTRLKQCIKPGSDCASFYAWEGTNNGYQLKAYSLKKDSNGGPEVTGVGSECSARIYNLTIGDPEYNPDCLEFYNSAGEIFYRLSSLVYTCSENCHAYRMSDSAQPCKNGGTWDDVHNACIYQAIPGEGKTCSAVENGCREYNGNNGNNTRVAARFNFENGGGGWYSNCPGGVVVSGVSNSKNGHSLKYTGSTCGIEVGEGNSQAKVPKLPIIKELLAAESAAQLKVNGLVSTGKSYSLKFIATANNSNSVNLQIYFKNVNAATTSAFTSVTVAPGTDWAIYEANLSNLDHEIGENEVLVITGSNSFYFDDLILTEITDRYYLIKGSAVTPDICSYDVYDNYVGPIYNLGCSQYTDRSNVKHNIHRFSKLCNGESIGCEQMISTNNYTPYGGNIWKDLGGSEANKGDGECDDDEPSCVKIGSHQMIYAIYDATKKCNASMKGCSRLGEGRGTTTNMVWSDVYKKNDPNEYDKILCSQDELGCDEWQNVGGNGYSYFKDPGNEACVYRAANSTTTVEKAWYKIPVKRCDLAPSTPDGVITAADFNISSSTCMTAADCEDEKPCIVDNNDYFCATSTLKTIGYGGQGNQIQTPSSTAALCVPASSGCTEYIDPISQFSPNLVKNPDYLTINFVKEGWIVGIQNNITIEPNKLYIFGISSESGSNSGDVTLQFTKPVKTLLLDNTFSTSTNTFSLTITTGDLRHILFNSMTNTSTTVIGGAEGKTIEVRAAVVDYQLQNNIDKKTCNGLVDFGKGCVLFNERVVNGSKGLISLASGWDAYSTLVGKAPASCNASSTGSCNSNTLLKVQPNRICSKWLDCSSYIIDPKTKEKVCYAAEECTRLNDKNECDNFVYADTSNRVFNSKTDRNATGYSLLDKYYVGQMNEVGVDSEAHYDFEESIPALSCRRAAPDTRECNFDKNIITDSLVREPVGSPVDYPAHGKTYLKVPVAYEMSPISNNNWISVIKSRDYYLNYLVNTKNSVTGAKITILYKDEGGNITSTSTVVTANNGWERKIFKFSSGVNKLIKIYLGADIASAQGFVYFDDLNIEPVLQIGNNAYVARECRLYPASDSLTCRSKNNQVIQDGWEGYCLEHDANNPNVCSLWYPVDKISSAKTGLSPLGYSGKFPLNYCTEADGNFSLVEKRIPKVVKTFGCMGNKGWFSGGEDHHFNGYDLMAIYANNLDEIEDYYHDKAYIQKSSSNVTGFCGPDAVGNYWVLVRPHGNFTECEQGYYSFTCMPAYLSRGFVVKLEKEIALIPKMSECDCEDTGYQTSDAKIDGYTGWYSYNGFSSYSVSPTPDKTNFLSSVNEVNNADPPVRIYDYDNPPADEDGLKLVSGSDRDKVFNITCKSFTQLVDYDGQNKAWTYRTSKESIYSTSTPDFFWYPAISNLYSGSPFLLNLYGRNRQDTPFGAAAWDDNYDLLSSEPIKFSNQYSKKDNQTVFAGRPYGCDNGSLGSGCYNMGQCSLNPNVFCLYSTFPGSSSYDLNKKSCADGGYGTCVRLWAPGRYLGMNSPDYEYILRSIFLKPYNSFSYNPSSGSYITGNLSFPDYSISIGNPCPGGSRNPSNSFCAVYPIISNVTLKFNGVKKDDGGGLKFEIKNKGIYSLEFNTEVDKEQQPLKRIEIMWGDGTTQVITGQDNRSSILNPHIFYHYYVPTYNIEEGWYKQIEINIYDNWGFYSSIGG